MKLIAFATIGTAALLSAPAAIAQAEWSGEGSLSAGYTTGNTETTDAGAGLKATRDALNWRQRAKLKAQGCQNCQVPIPYCAEWCRSCNA